MKLYQKLFLLISVLSGISLFTIYKPSTLSLQEGYRTECAGQVVEQCDQVINNINQYKSARDKTFYIKQTQLLYNTSNECTDHNRFGCRQNLNDIAVTTDRMYYYETTNQTVSVGAQIPNLKLFCRGVKQSC